MARGHRLLAAGQPGWRAVSVWPAIEPGPPGSQGRGPACLSPAARAEAGRASEPGTCPAAAQPLCRRTSPPSPAALRRGRGHPSWQQAEPAGAAASARHRGRSLPRPAIPVPAARHFARPRGAVNQRMEGAGAYHSPCTSRVPAVYLPWTWPRNSRPAANLTPPAPGAPAHGQDRDAARQGQVTARSTGGQRQVGGRSAGGRPGVDRRSTPGQWRLAAWASAPIRYP